MNARERFNNTLQFKPVDRYFRWEYTFFWDETLARWRKEGLPADVSDFRRYFAIDPREWIPVAGGWAGNPYCPMFAEKIIAEDDHYLTRLEQDGIIKLRLKGSETSCVPQMLKFPVENIDDFRNLTWRLDYRSQERLPVNWNELVAKYQTRDFPLGLFVLGPFGFIRNLIGDLKLMYSVYDDQELLRAIMAHWLEFYQGYLERVCRDVVPDFAMMWEDDCYSNGPLISPDSYRALLSPWFKELVASMKRCGIQGIIVDCDGDIRKMIPVYLECGVNCFFPMQVLPGMDIVELRKEYGHEFAMFGGLDKRALAKGRQDILRELEDKVPFMLQSGGYIPSVDHGCPPDISLDNFMFYVNQLRIHGDR